MAGSRKWFVYTTDLGTDFAIEKDESNTEAVNGGTQDMPDTPPVDYAIPVNLKPRYARFTSADGTVSRSVVCLTETIFEGLGPGSTFTDATSGKVVILTLKVGERVRIPKGVDTGLTDGDAT